MSKVKISTMKATSEPIPKDLIGLDSYTLQNLQEELDPVPDQHLDTEYWPDVDVTPAHDSRYQTLGAATLTVNQGNKTVSVAKAIVDNSNQVINQFVRSELSKRTVIEMAADYTIGNVTTNRAELEAFRDELDGSEISEINLKNDSYTLTIAQQNNIRNSIKARYRAINKRSFVIAELIKAAPAGADRVSVLDAEINTGWPV